MALFSQFYLMVSMDTVTAIVPRLSKCLKFEAIRGDQTD